MMHIILFAFLWLTAHAFFTIQPSPGKDDESEIQFHLSRLSNEFVFSSPSSHSKDIADVIQFASGLDLIGSDDDQDGKIMISYGINDCEAVIMFVGLDLVNKLLLPVNDGDEVIHVMKKLDL
jgi:pyruvate/2-oxoglutarate/acetoin dehydrogenase E1 component